MRSLALVWLRLVSTYNARLLQPTEIFYVTAVKVGDPAVSFLLGFTVY